MYGISTGSSFGTPRSWEGRVSGNHLSGVTCINKVEGDSNMTIACVHRLGGMKVQQRTNRYCQHLCMRESHPSSPHPAAQQLSTSCMSLVLFEQLLWCWISEPMSLSASKPGCGPLKRNIYDSCSPPTQSAATSTGFHSQRL